MRKFQKKSASEDNVLDWSSFDHKANSLQSGRETEVWRPVKFQDDGYEYIDFDLSFHGSCSCDFISVFA